MAYQNDSFIDEVTQELRRDRLAVAMRRYGWVVLLLILALVGATAWREYSRTRIAGDAQAFGDALLTAADGGDAAAALAQVPTDDVPGRAALAGLLQADAQLTAGDRPGAAATLARIGADTAAPAALRDLARLKALALEDTTADPARRDAALTELSAPGAPYRLLAMEQRAVSLVEAGKQDEAVTLVQQIQQEDGVSENLKNRLAGMLVTLGVEAEPAAPGTGGLAVQGADPAAGPADVAAPPAAGTAAPAPTGEPAAAPVPAEAPAAAPVPTTTPGPTGAPPADPAATTTPVEPAPAAPGPGPASSVPGPVDPAPPVPAPASPTPAAPAATPPAPAPSPTATPAN